MAIKQISVFLENKPGTLDEMTGILAQSGITLYAISMAETKDFGIVRMIVDDVFKTVTVLKDHDYIYNMTPVLAVMVPNVVGGLNQMLSCLTAAKVNLEYMYSTLSPNEQGHAFMMLRVADTQAAEEALRKAGFKYASGNDISLL